MKSFHHVLQHGYDRIVEDYPSCQVHFARPDFYAFKIGHEVDVFRDPIAPFVCN